MHTKAKKILSALATMMLLLVWFGLFVLVFYLPRVTASWARTGQELPPILQLLSPIGNLTSQYFLVIAPPLLGITGAAYIWRIHVKREPRRTTATS